MAQGGRVLPGQPPSSLQSLPPLGDALYSFSLLLFVLHVAFKLMVRRNALRV